MLILTRRPAESLTIGDAITIRVMEIKGSRVRIGIVAPRGTAVRREEALAKERSRPAVTDADP